MKYDRSKVTVIIPAKNEAEGLGEMISSLKRYAKDIIVIDGHSTDATKAIVRQAGVRYFLDHNMGRGDALRFGLSKAQTDVIVIVDADGSVRISDIPRLALPIMGNQADLVVASRRTGGSSDTEPTFSGLCRSAGADLLTYMVNRYFRTHLTDILYCFRAMRRDIIPNLHLQANGFDFDQENVVSCLKRGYRVMQVPSREYARRWGISKLRTLMGIPMFFRLLKQLYFG
jgi:glycosyltransferase involved in cell wall biosynthesis